MNTIDTITDELDKKLRETEVFQDSKIFQREEMEGDEEPRTEAVYLWPDNPQADENDFSMDFRIYPINIMVKFDKIEETEGFHEDEDDRKSGKRNIYFDALMTFIKSWNTSDHGTNLYHMAFKTAILKYQPEETDYLRMLVVVDCHTVEAVV